MIEDILRSKYGQYLDGLDIYENAGSLILSRIIIKKEARNSGIGTQILENLVKYADANKQIIALTPASDFGGSKIDSFNFIRDSDLNIIKVTIRAFNLCNQ